MKKIYIILIILFNFFNQNIFCLKDPFAIPDFNKKNKILKNNQISLEGIIKTNNQYGAILSNGVEKKIVFLNDSIWNYKVQEINLNYVIINRGSKILKLLIN